MYGFPKPEDHHLTWELLRSLAQNDGVPWLIGGDFNEILWSHEKFGGPIRVARQMEEFREVVEELAWRDLMFSGPEFTWTGNRHGEMIKVRLDRFFMTDSWNSLFPRYRVLHLKPNDSDHLPILVEFSKRKRKKKKKRKKKRFRFEDIWLREADCQAVVEKGWKISGAWDPFEGVCRRISSTREALTVWSSDRFAGLKKEIEAVRSDLADCYKLSSSVCLRLHILLSHSPLPAIDSATFTKHGKIL